MVENSELERLREKKLKEMKGQGTSSQSGIDHPINLTDANFNNELSQYPLILVDFWAPWCGPCRMVAPILESLAKEYTGKIVIGKLNVDENPTTAGKFGVMSIPTLIIFNNGEPVDTIVGALPKSALEDRINKILAS